MTDQIIRERAKPIHDYFELTYATHLILDDTRARHLDNDWADAMGQMVDELWAAFPDVHAGVEYVVLAAEESAYGELTEAQMRAMDVSTNADALHEDCDHQDEDEVADCEDRDLYYYDWRGDEHDHLERVMVPTETETEARQRLRYALPRTLLQSMPAAWQQRLVALMEQYDELDVETPEAYAIHFYRDGIRTTDPVPSYNRGRTQLVPTGPVPS
jgi:hypothetical protein